MNNKGFTLVELLAVMVILVAISFVAVTGISSSLEKRDEKEGQEQQELAIGAAKIYFSLIDNKEGIPCVEIETLINDGYISDGKKVDKLDKTYVIKLVDNEYRYMSSCQ